MDRADITPDVLRSLLKYNPKTGKLSWKKRGVKGFDAQFAGKQTFLTTSNGYKIGSVMGHTFMASRVAWAIATGEMPKGEIDHINGDRADNRLRNLRDVTCTENRHNKAANKNNKSGVGGVAWITQSLKWRAYITVDKKNIILGHFSKKGDAVKARLDAQKQHGFTDRHGLPSERKSA